MSLVLDIGSFSAKIGVGGDAQPIEERTVSVTQIVEEKESTKSNVYYGNKAIDVIKQTATDKQQQAKKTNTINTDISVENKEIISFLESVIFKNGRLKNVVQPSRYRLLLTDQLMSNESHRSLLSEVLFESFKTPSVFYEIGGVLGLYATGRLDGLICDIGHSQTSLVPIVRGYAIDYASRKMKIGGIHMDEYFNALLRKSGIALHTEYQCEIVRDIKEKTAQCRLESAYEKLQDDEEMNCEQYQMPDGTILQIGNARYRSTEVFVEICFILFCSSCV